MENEQGWDPELGAGNCTIIVYNYVDTPTQTKIPSNPIQIILPPGTGMLVTKLLIRPECGWARVCSKGFLMGLRNHGIILLAQLALIRYDIDCTRY